MGFHYDFFHNRLILSLLVPLYCLYYPRLLFADGCQFDYKKKEIQVNISEDLESGELYIRFRIGEYKKLDIFLVENPYRLVVDASGRSSSITRRLEIPDCGSIKALRFGNHPDKFRAVFDLERNTPPKFVFKESPGKFLIILENPPRHVVVPEGNVTPSPAYTLVPITSTYTPIPRSASIEIPNVEILALERKSKGDSEKYTPTISVSSIEKLETPTEVAPLLTPTATSLPTPSIVPSPTLTITLLPTLKPVPTITPSKAVTITPTAVPPIKQSLPSESSSTEQSLNDVLFSYNQRDRSPLIRLVFQRKPEFRLIKKDDRLYHISVSNCLLKHDFLALPQFPPHDFIGFTLVSPKVEQGGIEILIGVERGIRVSANPKDNEIWVRLTNK